MMENGPRSPVVSLINLLAPFLAKQTAAAVVHRDSVLYAAQTFEDVLISPEAAAPKSSSSNLIVPNASFNAIQSIRRNLGTYILPQELQSCHFFNASHGALINCSAEVSGTIN